MSFFIIFLIEIIFSYYKTFAITTLMPKNIVLLVVVTDKCKKTVFFFQKKCKKPITWGENVTRTSVDMGTEQ